MQCIPVYVITTPKGKTLVRTDPPSVDWYRRTPGYTVTEGVIYPPAAKAIAAEYAAREEAARKI